MKKLKTFNRSYIHCKHCFQRLVIKVITLSNFNNETIKLYLWKILIQVMMKHAVIETALSGRIKFVDLEFSIKVYSLLL